MKDKWIGHILRRNCLLKHVIEGKIEGREDEEEDISSYWITFNKKKILEREIRRTRLHSEKFTSEEAINLYQDRLRNE
jgi:hypothetical protein